jgi:hypothetical protein
MDFEIPFVDSINEQHAGDFPDVGHLRQASPATNTRSTSDQRERASVIPTEQRRDKGDADRSRSRQPHANRDDVMRTEPDRSASLLPATAGAAGGVVASGTATEPWSATRCVIAFQIDPADETHWIIENGCTTAVGIVIASCTQRADQCATNTAWSYRPNGMLLPAKAQRPVTQDESTQVGRRIRFVACNVTSAAGTRLIDTDRAMSSSREWNSSFQSATEIDGCIEQVRQWSEAGRRSSQSLEALFGVPIPANRHDRN